MEEYFKDFVNDFSATYLYWWTSALQIIALKRIPLETCFFFHYAADNAGHFFDYYNEYSMGSLIHGTDLSTSDVWDLQIKAYSALYSSARWVSVLAKYKLHEKWMDKTREALCKSSSISSEAGCATLLYLQQDCAQNFDEYCLRYLSCPASFQTVEMWALLQVVQRAELQFLNTCSSLDTEVSLTGSLIQLLETAALEFTKEHSDLLTQVNSTLSLKKLELQVKRREKKTGGDFAFILEWRDGAGSLNICPVIFQAKRVDGVQANISQRHKQGGYQSDILAKSNCNPSYIFYNCNSGTAIESPRLPTVKMAADVGEEEKHSNTSAVENVLSLSIFMLNILSKKDFFYSESRAAALSQILKNSSKLELRDLLVFSPDSAALMQYQRQLQSYQQLQNRLIAPPVADDGVAP